MTNAERIMKRIEELVKYCPFCGKEFVTVERVIGRPPAFKKIWTRIVKTCPENHGDMDVDYEQGGPCLVFAVNDQLFLDVE